METLEKLYILSAIEYKNDGYIDKLKRNMEKAAFEAEIQKTSKNLSLKNRVCNLWSGITVEPVIICFVLPFSMSTLTIQNLSLEKACRVNLNMSTSICDAIQQRNHSGYNETDEIIVQKIVATASIWKNVVYSVFPALLLPFFGSWSDRNRTRKVLMLMPIIGEILTNVGFILCTFFFYQLPMEVNTVIEVLPTASTGGANMLLLGVFTYISAVSSVEDRTFRVGVIHILFGVNMTIGTALSGVMYNLMGFYGVFTVSLVIYTIGGIYVYYNVNETAAVQQKSLTTFELIKDIANLKQTINTFKFLVKPNRTVQLKQICVIIILAILVLGPFIGEMTVMYLYTRIKFSWSEIDFSLFYTYYSVAHLVGSFIAISVFSKWLKYDDAIMGAISSISKICGGIIYILSKKPIVFYIGTLVEIFNGTAFVASRSMITKLVDPEDLGKVNSMFGFAESITVLLYGPMYSALYKATIHTFSGSFFVVGVSLTIPAVLLYLWLYSKRHERTIEDTKTNQNEEACLQDKLMDS